MKQMAIMHTEYQLVDQEKIGQGKGSSVSKYLIEDKGLPRRHQISPKAGWERRKRVIEQLEAAKSRIRVGLRFLGGGSVLTEPLA